MRPHHDDGSCIVERPRDFRTEPIAAVEPGLVPPNRTFSETCIDFGGKVTRHLAMPGGIANENLVHVGRRSSRRTGSLHGMVVALKTIAQPLP